jgi:hypothetical protein
VYVLTTSWSKSILPNRHTSFAGSRKLPVTLVDFLDRYKILNGMTSNSKTKGSTERISSSNLRLKSNPPRHA